MLPAGDGKRPLRPQPVFFCLSRRDTPRIHRKGKTRQKSSFLPFVISIIRLSFPSVYLFVRLKCKSQKKRKQKNAAATYLYQADCDGEWGEIQFDFENRTAQIIRLADWDKMVSQSFAKYLIYYLLNCQKETLPKETVISFEM